MLAFEVARVAVGSRAGATDARDEQRQRTERCSSLSSNTPQNRLYILVPREQGGEKPRRALAVAGIQLGQQRVNLA